MYVTIVSLVFLGLCFSGVTASGNDEDIAANLTEAIGEGVYGQDGVDSPFYDLEKDVAVKDAFPVDSHTGDAIDMADKKEQEALRVLEAPTTSNDEQLGVDAVDVAETMMNQDATGEQVLVSHGLRQYGNGRNASYLASYNGWHYYKVPVSGAMTSTNVKSACEEAGYVTPCSGNSRCQYASSSCEPTGLSQCNRPMYEISQALCGGYPSYCPQMHGVYQFMNNWGGSACGAESGHWCVAGSRRQDRYAFCARGWNVTTMAPVNTTTAAQDPTTAPEEAQNCDQWTGWFDRDNPSGNGDYETLVNLRQENPGKICSSPSAIQARVRGSQVPASQTGEHFDFYDTDIGLACRNSHQSDRYCQDYEVRFCCSQNPNSGTTKAPANPTITTQGPTNAPTEPPNCDRWTGWFDRDHPSGSGDFETLLHLRPENPGKICSTPSAIQARVRGSQVPASQTGEHFYYYNTVDGFACRNADQSDRYCQDYEVRFCCSQRPNPGTTKAPANPTITTQGPTNAPTEPPNCDRWTGWFDRDHPSGNGDFETLLHLRRENPGNICSTPSAIQARVRGSQVPASQTGEHFDYYDTDVGFACTNYRQSDNNCQDYEVRFCCSQNPNSGRNVTTMAPVSTTIATPGTTTADNGAPKLLPTPPADISASTTCTNEYMELSIPEDQLTDINSNNLHWKPDRNCGATTNGTHYIFRTELYGCGTQVKFGPRYVEFVNTINILGTHFNTGVITRDSDISITSKCNYERQEWVESTFLPIPGGLNFTEEGFGQLEVRLSMFPTRQYQRQYRANQYPIHLRLRQHVYMQLEVQGHGQKLSVLALNCKATMSPSPNDSLQYQLIRDGCASDPTLKTYDVDDPGKERFGFEAFRFIREVRTVYVHCEVLVCDAADSGSRCAQGCVKRGKRAVGISDMRGRHMIYQGPIILDGDKEAVDALYLEESRQTTSPGPRSGLWTTMAAGGVLMALALLVIGAATILKRSRRDKWAYQGLPNMEEDRE